MAVNIIDEIFFGKETIETLQEHINMLRFIMPVELGLDKAGCMAILFLKEEALKEQLYKKELRQRSKIDKKRFYNKTLYKHNGPTNSRNCSRPNKQQK
jgi:hypothetical protein